MKKLLLLALSLVLFAACSDDDSTEHKKYYRTDGVFVCSEGAFGKDEAMLSFYDLKTGEVENDVFYKANAWKLGDGLQSMSIIDGVGYLCVTQTGRLITFDPETFKYKIMFVDAVQPRYVANIGKKLYVSSLGSQEILSFELGSLKFVDKIDLGKEGDKINTSEQIIAHGGNLYVNMWSYGDKIFKINPTKEDEKKIESTLKVNYQPNSMVMDKNNKLWVLSGGAWDGSIAPALTRIDPVKMTIEKKLEFESGKGAPSKLCINKAGDKLYFLKSVWGNNTTDSGVYTMNITDEALPATALIDGPGKSFYGLGIDPSNSEIYVSNPLDFTQPGIVYRYSADGTELKAEFKVGVAPGSFCFKEVEK